MAAMGVEPARCWTARVQRLRIYLDTLAEFSLEAANEPDGPNWMKQLAVNPQADAITNPNSKLRIPVSLAASKAVAKVC